MSQEPIVPASEGHGSLLTPFAGAVIWMAYFMLVYLLAEARCTIAVLDFDLLGLPTSAVVTVVLTVAAAVLIAVYMVGSWRRLHQTRGPTDLIEQGSVLGLLGVLSGAIFVIATFSVGLPVLFLPPC